MLTPNPPGRLGNICHWRRGSGCRRLSKTHHHPRRNNSASLPLLAASNTLSETLENNMCPQAMSCPWAKQTGAGAAVQALVSGMTNQYRKIKIRHRHFVFLWTQVSVPKRGLKMLLKKYSRGFFTLGHTSPYTWSSVMWLLPRKYPPPRKPSLTLL